MMHVPIEIDPGETDKCDREAAAAAVRQQCAEESKEHRLVAKSAIRVSGIGPRIFFLELEGFPKLNWSWEGAQASGKEPASEEAPARAAWRGEVIEADLDRSRLFVLVEEGQPDAIPGPFSVLPFNYLAALDRVYAGWEGATHLNRLSKRLELACGGQTPMIPGETGGLEFLRKAWRYRWCVLWGPPGTGKTYMIGRQVADVIAPGGSGERILVVSTTNKATDEVAIAIGRALSERTGPVGNETVIRAGKGVDYRRFEAEGLRTLVEDCEDNIRGRLRELQQESERTSSEEDHVRLRAEIRSLQRNLRDTALYQAKEKKNQAVVATAFKALTFLLDEEVRKGLDEGKALFDTIIVDEASMISRAAVAALSLLAGKRVWLVGDPKQLSPVIRHNKFMPNTLFKWIVSSALQHLRRAGEEREGVVVLTKQYRMHPQIRAAVSNYQYGGVLSDAPGMETRMADAEILGMEERAASR